MAAEQPLGPRRLDLTALSDQDFEEMCCLVVLLDHADATASRSPDGGADALLPLPSGGWERGWQAKHYPVKIHWQHCEDSLDRAIENFAISRMTFLFPKDLTLNEQREFQEKLVARHEEVIVDYRGATEILAKLVGSDEGLKIVDRYFGESPHLMAELIEEVRLLRKMRDMSGPTAAVAGGGGDVSFTIPARRHGEALDPPRHRDMMMNVSATSEGQPVRWLVAPDPAELVNEGFQVIAWPDLVRMWVSRARAVGMRRSSLANAAQDYLDWLSEVGQLAVVGVSLDGPGGAADLLGFVVEPAVRYGVELVIGADRPLEELNDDRFVEPKFGYAYSLDRLRWQVRAQRPVLGPPAILPGIDFVLDPAQQAAVNAGEGVVQVIAPAGSGKTSVLVERVRELRRRGVRPDKIVCLTFDLAANLELKQRLTGAGLHGIDALTFHGLGYQVLTQAGLRAGGLPERPTLKGASLAEWMLLAARVMGGDGAQGVWIEPTDAHKLISDIKLGLLMTPDEYADSLTSDSDDLHRAVAALYREYEQFQRARNAYDYDDLIFRSIRLLRENEQLREAWQRTYTHLLVDEYQDIEEAQELLIRLIAAPHDQLFCVGNEDQAVYPFRRASIERIISLDGAYPGLQRISLSVNYRCPPAIVVASSRLIAFNTVRFPKRIDPNPARTDDGVDPTRLHVVTNQTETAAEVAHLLAGKQRGQIAVLARTTNALRQVALACVELEVPIDGNNKLFAPSGARAALQDHLRLALDSKRADVHLIRSVCQSAQRSVAPGAEQGIAAALQAGEPFDIAFASVRTPKGSLALGKLLTNLGRAEDAAEAVRLLRDPGGLDRWVERADKVSELAQYERDVLADAEQDAAGLTPREYLATLDRQAAQLEAIRDDRNGIELVTIRGAKGRGWPHVVLLACDEGTLPHIRSNDATPEEQQRGEGIEAERRLAYVALTRAQQRLDIYHDKDRPSRFLEDAGLLHSRSPRPRPSRPMPRIPDLPG